MTEEKKKKQAMGNCIKGEEVRVFFFRKIENKEVYYTWNKLGFL